MVVGGLVAVLLLLLRHLTKNRGELEALGIPVDRPSFPLLGSGPHDLHNHVLHESTRDKFRQLGTRTYGRYDGVQPVITTMDPDVMKSVVVKEFDSFTDIFLTVWETLPQLEYVPVI